MPSTSCHISMASYRRCTKKVCVIFYETNGDSDATMNLYKVQKEHCFVFNGDFAILNILHELHIKNVMVGAY